MGDTQSRPSGAGGRFASEGHNLAFEAIMEGIAAGQAGIMLTGPPGSGKSALLAQVQSALSPHTVVWAALPSGASPRDVQSLLRDANGGSVQPVEPRRMLLVIDDVERVRRDTLDLLNSMTALLLDKSDRLQLLLAGRATFLDRLVTNESHALLVYLEQRVELPPLIADDGADWVTALARASGPAPPTSGRLAAMLGRPGGPSPRPEKSLEQANPSTDLPNEVPDVRRTSWRSIATGVAGFAIAMAAFVAWIEFVPTPAPAPAPAPAGRLKPSRAMPAPFLPAPALPAALPPDTSATVPPPAPELPRAPDMPSPGSTRITGRSPQRQADIVSTPLPAPAGQPSAAGPQDRSPFDDSPELGGPGQGRRRPSPIPPLAPAPTVQPAGEAVIANRPSGPGLLIVARPGDTLRRLYQKLYVGLKAPPFEEIVSVNPGPIRPGALLVFPTPPGGWQAR